MKKQNLKSLQLNKKAISNLKNLTGGYDETFIALCNSIFGDCDETADCDTQGGFACGETIGSFCSYRTYEVFGCN